MGGDTDFIGLLLRISDLTHMTVTIQSLSQSLEKGRDQGQVIPTFLDDIWMAILINAAGFIFDKRVSGGRQGVIP